MNISKTQTKKKFKIYPRHQPQDVKNISKTQKLWKNWKYIQDNNYINSGHQPYKSEH